MSTIAVSGSTELILALRVAKSGDSILLEAGTYSNVAIKNLNFADGVSITSKDPGHPAIVTDLMIQNSSGLTFSNIEFFIDGNHGSNPMNISKSNNIHFNQVNVHGSLDGDSSNDTSALLFQSSTNVSVKNSEFHQLANGVAHLDSNNVEVTGNSFHDIRMDGVRGGGSSNVVITKNFFTDFYRLEGDHPDAIQFWTSGAKVAAENIYISENVFTRGSGTPIQGIFLKDESGGSLPYKNVTITDNVIIGGMYNGITVNNGSNIVIDKNIVVGFSDMTSWIRLENVSGIKLSDNQSTGYLKDSNVVGKSDTGNSLINTPIDGGMSLLKAWLARHVDVADLVKMVGHDGSSLVIGNVRPDAGQDISLGGVPPQAALGALVGGAGNETLTSSLDTTMMAGGRGDDTYVVVKSSVAIIEEVGQGHDLVRSSVSYKLSANIEDLTLTGTADIDGVGNASDNYIIGNAGRNHLIGGEGNDTLDSGSGGRDLLEGGAGNDTYIINSLTTVVEGVDGGIDTVKSMYSITLGDNVENLILTNNGGASGNGNALDNDIKGNIGANRLAGLDGNDTIDGGAGNDLIFGGRGDDVLIGGAGADGFYFERGSGKDVITDFGLNGERDFVDFSAYLKAGIKAVVTDVGNDVLISFDAGNSVLIKGIEVTDLHATPTGYFFQ